MKVKGNGQAKILSSDELQALFSYGFTTPRDKALFAICLFSGCRISEALSLEKSDLFPNLIIFRKCNTWWGDKHLKPLEDKGFNRHRPSKDGRGFRL